MEQQKRWADYVCACAHFVCLPPFRPANFKEQAGRSQGFHNHERDPTSIDQQRGYPRNKIKRNEAFRVAPFLTYLLVRPTSFHFFDPFRATPGGGAGHMRIFINRGRYC